MRVILIASTVLHRERLAQFGYEQHPFPNGECETVLAADELVEVAGRVCYQSWDRPNPDTETNRGYVHNIIDKEHFSVMQHATATFYIDGISRTLSQQLVRHHHLSPSELSQRFVDSSDADFVTPPAFRHTPMLETLLRDHFEESIELYEDATDVLRREGMTRKEAREAARAFLPNCTETKLIVTGNLQAWREFIQKRRSPGADAEIRELADVLLQQLRGIAPNSFQDIVRAGSSVWPDVPFAVAG